MKLNRVEVNRKLLHVFSGSFFPWLIFYGPTVLGISYSSIVLILAGLCFLFLTMEVIRFRSRIVQAFFSSWGGDFMREREEGEFTGAIYLLLSALICSIIFHDRPDVSFIVLSVFIFGDAVAAVVGLSVGKIKIGDKSLEGTLAFIGLAVGACLFVYPYLPALLAHWGGQLPMGTIIIISLVSSLLELIPVRLSGQVTLNDNLYVPIVTGGFIVFFG